MLPGGTTDPDMLRTEPDVVSFISEFVSSGMPVAAICHGQWTLVSCEVRI